MHNVCPEHNLSGIPLPSICLDSIETDNFVSVDPPVKNPNKISQTERWRLDNWARRWVIPSLSGAEAKAWAFLYDLSVGWNQCWAKTHYRQFESGVVGPRAREGAGLRTAQAHRAVKAIAERGFITVETGRKYTLIRLNLDALSEYEDMLKQPKKPKTGEKETEVRYQYGNAGDTERYHIGNAYIRESKRDKKTEKIDGFAVGRGDSHSSSVGQGEEGETQVSHEEDGYWSDPDDYVAVPDCREAAEDSLDEDIMRDIGYTERQIEELRRQLNPQKYWDTSLSDLPYVKVALSEEERWKKIVEEEGEAVVTTPDPYAHIPYDERDYHAPPPPLETAAVKPVAKIQAVVDSAKVKAAERRAVREEKRQQKMRTHGVTSSDLERAWRDGLTACMGDGYAIMAWGGKERGQANTIAKKLCGADPYDFFHWVASNWAKTVRDHYAWASSQYVYMEPNLGFLVSRPEGFLRAYNDRFNQDIDRQIENKARRNGTYTGTGTLQ